MLGESGPFGELLLERRVGVVSRQLDLQISHLRCNLGGQGRDDIVESGTLGSDSPASELRFHLGEPDLRVSWPKGQEFEIDYRRNVTGSGCGHCRRCGR